MKILGMDAGVMFVVILLVLLAIIPARMARSKGYSYWTYYAFGLAFFLPALIVIMLQPDKNEQKLGSADEIAKYKALLDSGAITQEEFDKKKADLL